MSARALLDDPTTDPGWALALRSTLPAAAGRAVPTPAEVAGCEGAVEGLVRAGVHSARLAFARHDLAALQAWRGALSERSDGPALVLLDQQAALLEGRAVEDGPLADAEGLAARSGLAALVVDVAATRAFAALSRVEPEGARHHARRAVRMSRTEELTNQQYLAGVALARVRRFEQQPHMAIRILTALHRVAPPPFRGWVEHELRMAGEHSFWPEGRLAAARRLAECAPSEFVRADLDALIGLLDPDAGSPELAPWRTGLSDRVPRGLLAVEPAISEHHAHVLLSPDGVTRVLASAPAAAAFELVHSSRPGRLETALAVLAFASSPPAAEAFFEEVYGFAFEAAVHRGALEVLVHRLRDMLEDRAEILRDRGTIALRVHRPFAVPDPRVKRSLDDAVLRSLAQRPGATAKESAAHAGAPLRSVQHALKRLVEEGACEAKKQGRVVCYRVEDTTFTEPTRVLDWRTR